MNHFSMNTKPEKYMCSTSQTYTHVYEREEHNFRRVHAFNCTLSQHVHTFADGFTDAYS